MNILMFGEPCRDFCRAPKTALEPSAAPVTPGKDVILAITSPPSTLLHPLTAKEQRLSGMTPQSENSGLVY